MTSHTRYDRAAKRAHRHSRRKARLASQNANSLNSGFLGTAAAPEHAAADWTLGLSAINGNSRAA